MSRLKKIKKAVWNLMKCSFYLMLFLVILSRFILRSPHFDDSTSTVVLASNGQLLGARISDDEQWRFSELDSIPDKYSICLKEFEDKYFDYHFGFNPVSFFRALKVNYNAGKVVQGGSTLSMQLARIYLGNNKRTLFQKVKELLYAFHFEINYSKQEILTLYASHAPYGGNVVGLSAASWRYYGRPVEDLSWSESAMFAVLPNAPSLIFPGKNQERLKEKRNKLLKALHVAGSISEEELKLAMIEPIPLRPMKLPDDSRHFVDRMAKERKGRIVHSTIDQALQKKTQGKINHYISFLKDNKIFNACAMVIDVKTQSIKSYVGNSTIHGKYGNQVDIITANRSTGSVLKPFLYASMLSKEELLPDQLLSDVPTYYKGYNPKNFFKDFDGVVKVKEALYRSLNVPFVRLLEEYKTDRFYTDLKQLGMNSLSFTSDHYGLSLILGGAEGNLYNLASIYAGMSKQLSDGEYSSHLSYDEFGSKQKRNEKTFLSDASVYHTFDAIQNAKRPASHSGWKTFSSSRKVGWKTGTSFGGRDAWAIGVTPEYVVAVWVGNADGEGRRGLTGLSAAAPIMFDIYSMLEETTWWLKPTEGVREVEVCKQSGLLPSIHCDAKEPQLMSKTEKLRKTCSYHRLIHLDEERQYQVHSSCEDVSKIKHESWFVLSPLQEWFYKKKTPLYRSLPPFRSDCQGVSGKVMEFIYPNAESKLFIPVDLDGEKNDLVFKLTHQNAKINVYWYIDQEYLGLTNGIHEMAFQTGKGSHTITVMDEEGKEARVKFEVISE